MYVILSPSHLPYIFLSWPYTTRPWHRDHIFSSPQLILVWIIKEHLILSTFQTNNMFSEVLNTFFLHTELAWKPTSMLLFQQSHPKCLEPLPVISDAAFDLAVFWLLQVWHESNIPVFFYIWNQLYFKALMSSGQLYIISSEIYLLNRCETDLVFHYSV